MILKPSELMIPTSGDYSMFYPNKGYRRFINFPPDNNNSKTQFLFLKNEKTISITRSTNNTCND
jgi:hypothetical protein